MWGCAGKYSTWVSIFSTEYPLSVTVPVSGCWQGWFPLPGLPGYLLCRIFTVGLSANLLGTSSQAHQLAMSLTVYKLHTPKSGWIAIDKYTID